MIRTLLSAAVVLAASNVFAQSAETISNQAPVAFPDGSSNGPVWNAPNAVLFTNGTFVSAPTGGGTAGNQAVSVLTPPDTSLGATCNTTGFRLADNFTVATAVTVQKVTVFGYQTQAAPGGSTVSTFTSGTLRIWNGVPGAAGSTVVFGDTTTNRLTASTFSGAWRVTNTTLTNVQRGIIANEFGGLTVALAAGNYWIDYGLVGSTASGPFCPPNNTVAATNNALQLDVAGAVWNPLTDGGSARPLDLPFIIEGLGEPVGPVFTSVPTLSIMGLIAAALTLIGVGVVATRRHG